MTGTDAAPLLLEPTIGTLRIADGANLQGAGRCTAELTPDAAPVRSRAGERLIAMLDLQGPAGPRLYEALHAQLSATYWATEGSITSALRRAALMANIFLFRRNLQVDAGDRAYGGLICVVQRRDEAFILQIGPVRSCVMQADHLRCFAGSEKASILGVGPIGRMKLDHTFIGPSDAILLASTALFDALDRETMEQALRKRNPEAILDHLKRSAFRTNFTASILRFAPRTEPALDGAAANATAEAQRRPSPTQGARPSRGRRAAANRARPKRSRPDQGGGEATADAQGPSYLSGRSVIVGQSAWTDRASSPPASASRAKPQETRRTAKTPETEPTRDRAANVRRSLRQALNQVGQTAATLGGGLAGGARALGRGVLPGAEDQRRREKERRRRRVPKENASVMTGLSIAVPVLIMLLVILAYRTHGVTSRFTSLIEKANDEAALAEEANDESTRTHWENVLHYTAAAATLQPDGSGVNELRLEAREALDEMDGIVRVRATRMVGDFEPDSTHRLLLHNQFIYVINPGPGWIAQLPLTADGEGLAGQGDLDLVHTGKRISGGEGGAVGELVDAAWVEAAGGRQTDALMILEGGGAMITYDPAWEDRLIRFKLNPDQAPSDQAKRLETFEGHLYILDVLSNQILRYEPTGDQYLTPPEGYFPDAPPIPPSNGAVDMAIDGHAYVLYEDGSLLKFLQGARQPFEVRNLPGDLEGAVDIALSPPLGPASQLLIADRDERRIVVLSADGEFQRQYRTEGAFDALEALAINEDGSKLYVMSAAQLYVVSLP